MDQIFFLCDDRFLPREFLHSPGVQKNVDLDLRNTHTRFLDYCGLECASLSLPLLEMSVSSRDWWNGEFQLSESWRSAAKLCFAEWSAKVVICWIQFFLKAATRLFYPLFQRILLFVLNMSLGPRPSARRRAFSFFPYDFHFSRVFDLDFFYRAKCVFEMWFWGKNDIQSILTIRL